MLLDFNPLISDGSDDGEIDGWSIEFAYSDWLYFVIYLVFFYFFFWDIFSNLRFAIFL